MKVKIGRRWIGEGEPCFIIAEAGSNHNGDIDHAKRLIEVASCAGADAVKFQVFRADRLYSRGAGVSDYLKMPRPIYDIIADLEMPYVWLSELAAHCQKKDILFLASVFDEESADQLDPHVEAFKIASYEITHIPLVRYVAHKKKPVILSTGTANLEEVVEIVDEFRRTGNGDLILMQCTAAYPAPLESLNVRAITTMRSRFGVPVGLSDHSRDPLVGPLAAVALGANVLEKHFTLSNESPGPDHRFAVEPAELGLMIRKVRELEKAMGSGEKVMNPIEAELREFARRSIFAVRDIEAGETFSKGNIAILRCGNLKPYLEPKHFQDVLGKRAQRNIAAESAIQREDYA